MVSSTEREGMSTLSAPPLALTLPPLMLIAVQVVCGSEEEPHVIWSLCAEVTTI